MMRLGMHRLAAKYLAPLFFLLWTAVVFKSYFPQLTLARIGDALLVVPRGIAFVLRYLEPTP